MLNFPSCDRQAQKTQTKSCLQGGEGTGACLALNMYIMTDTKTTTLWGA